MTPDRLIAAGIHSPMRTSSTAEHRIVAGVDEVSDVEHPADGDRRAARQAVIQLGPRVGVPPRLGAHAARRPFLRGRRP